MGQRRAGSMLGVGALLGLVALGATPPSEPPAAWVAPGAALRAGLEAEQQGDRGAAAARFARIREQHPWLADYAGWLEARARLAEGDAEGAGAAAHAALAQVPDSPIRVWLYGLLGDARFTLDDEEKARAAWETALAMARDRADKARLRLAIGGAHERAGRELAAAREYRAIWSRLPTEAEAGEAERRLAALEKARGESLRRPSDYLKRADRLFAAHRNEEALAAYRQALAGELPAARRAHAERREAHALFRLRRYREASEAFAQLGDDGDAPVWHARSLARSGRVPQAIQELEKLAAAERAESAWARLLAALLLDGEDQHARAVAHFRQLAEQDRDRNLAAAALWRLGWAAYREGQYAEARALLLELAEREEDPLAGLRARYWAARAGEEAGAEEARSELEALARRYPFSYYGWRAAERLGGARGEEPQEPLARGTARLSGRDLLRARVLLEAGLDEAARLELRAAGRRARGLDDRLELARLYAEAQDFHSAQRLIVDAYAEPLARGPRPGLEELWWLAWPDAYAESVRRAASQGPGVERELLLAVMREESGYRPQVVSAAGAFGLLQLMPETAERVARQLGVPPPRGEDLFIPAVNLQLGGFYLAGLRQRFATRLSAAIASYNAGPEAVARWIEETPVEDDVWVESIPYQQTRSYVRRVLRSLHVYRALY